MPLNITNPHEVIEQDRHQVSVLRHEGGDCTLNGVTSRYTSFMLCKDYDEAHRLVEDGANPETVLVLDLQYPAYPRAFPYVVMRDKQWGMAGGNYVVSCDSRYKLRLPIPVLDRVEK